MKKIWYAFVAKILGRNLNSTPKEVILDQMHEPRPLPMGRQEFEEWAGRIISGALVPGGDDDKEAFIDSQKFALAEMIMHLGKTESHKPDAYFIHTLRKGAVNQVAHTFMVELKAKHEARKKAQAEAAAPAETPKADVGEPARAEALPN